MRVIPFLAVMGSNSRKCVECTVRSIYSVCRKFKEHLTEMYHGLIPMNIPIIYTHHLYVLCQRLALKVTISKGFEAKHNWEDTIKMYQ